MTCKRNDNDTSRIKITEDNFSNEITETGTEYKNGKNRLRVRKMSTTADKSHIRVFYLKKKRFWEYYQLIQYKSRLKAPQFFEKIKNKIIMRTFISNNPDRYQLQNCDVASLLLILLEF